MFFISFFSRFSRFFRFARVFFSPHYVGALIYGYFHVHVHTVQYPLSVLVLVHTAKMAESPSLRNFEPVFNVLEHLF